MPSCIAHGYFRTPAGHEFTLVTSISYSSTFESAWRAVQRFRDIQGENDLFFMIMHTPQKSVAFSASDEPREWKALYDNACVEADHRMPPDTRRLQRLFWPAINPLLPSIRRLLGLTSESNNAPAVVEPDANTETLTAFDFRMWERGEGIDTHYVTPTGERVIFDADNWATNFPAFRAAQEALGDTPTPDDME